LLAAGIPAYRIKAVSLGEEGVLCVDMSDLCRHINRRVHLDIRKIGQAHMTLPPPAATTAIDPSEPATEPSQAEDAGSISENLPPSSSDPEGIATDPITGS
jgi:peptidoglycan-associated lipoprotein